MGKRCRRILLRSMRHRRRQGQRPPARCIRAWLPRENEDSQQACRDAGLGFIGPSPEAIRAMGNKAGQGHHAEGGRACVPGYQGGTRATRDAAEGQEDRLPVRIKAVAAGRARHAVGAEPQHFQERCAARGPRRQGAFGDPT